MENLMKRAAGNIGSKFGMLQAHTSLVLTISEENQVYEGMLKLILARVNSATSLLKWVRGEDNVTLQMAVEKLYDVMLMWATVQKQFAEQYHLFSKSLKEILDVECGIDAIKKEHKEAEEKLEKLKKQGDCVRIVRRTESNRFMSFQDEVRRAEENVNELSSELQVKTLKSEIFKASRIRTAFTDLMSDCTLMADNTKAVFNAARQIVEQIPEMPPHLAKNRSPIDDDGSLQDEILDDLAAELNIERPKTTHSKPTKKQQPVFHVGLPQKSLDHESNKVMLKIQSSSPPKPMPYNANQTPPSSPVFALQKNDPTNKSKSCLKVTVDNRAPLPLPRRKTTKGKKEKSRDKLSSDASDYKGKMGSCKPPPMEPPPPLPGSRQRSKSSSVSDLAMFYEEPLVMKRAEFRSQDFEANSGYVEPSIGGESSSNTKVRLTRSSSEGDVLDTNGNLKRTASQSIPMPVDYCDPMDSYTFAWSASPPNECFDEEQHYNEPFDALLGSTRQRLVSSDRYAPLNKYVSSPDVRQHNIPQARRLIASTGSCEPSSSAPSSPKSPRAGEGKNVKEMVALLHDKVKLTTTSNCHVATSVMNL